MKTQICYKLARHLHNHSYKQVASIKCKQVICAKSLCKGAFRAENICASEQSESTKRNK